VKPAGKADYKAIVDPHQATVKRPVVESVEAETVSRVEPIRGVLGPWDNVAGHEELRNTDACDATPTFVG